MTELDHIVVAAHTLDQGVTYVRSVLGIEMQVGGAHPRMGTHNRVLRLGEALYLEVIAIDPDAPRPARRRWFQLDDAAVQSELRVAPRLITWVVRTTDIAETVRACSWAPGEVEPMERGALHWRITVPRDGALVGDGMLPSVMEWAEQAHPASRMQDLGCTLERLEVAHADPALYRRDLASIGADRHLTIRELAPGARPQLVAQIRTPAGIRALR